MRISRKGIEARLQTARELGNFPQGPYPATVGALVLEHNLYGYHVAVTVNQHGAVKELSPTGMSARECWDWLGAFITALDLPRLRQHWNLPTA